MNKLLKDAIADAKAVRETALANAKATLEEAFAPKLQSMLSHKIKEELDDEMPEADVEDELGTPSEEELAEKARMKSHAGIGDEDGGEEALSKPPAPDEEAPQEDETPEEAPPVDGGDDLGGDDLGTDDIGGDDLDDEAEGDEVSDEELAELLRELEGEDDEDEPEVPEAPMMEGDAATDDTSSDEQEPKEEEINLDEIIKALKEEDEPEQEDKMEEASTMKVELEEAYSVIKHLRFRLNELNLLNAKLLFVSKLFKKNELTEAQKVRVVETFDRAKSVREAKLIYTTLVESIRTKSVAKPTTKKRMAEGLASAPQKKTEIITESSAQFNRFKDLVNFNR